MKGLYLMKGGLVIVFVLGATANGIAQKGKPYYHEDLYGLRPQYSDKLDSAAAAVPVGHKKGTVIPLLAVNAKVDDVLDSINRFHITRKFIDGFTIQVYSGQNREEAMNSKKKLMGDAPDLNAELEYNQPKFRVRVGSYFSRLEAQRDLYRLKKSFSNAILVPEKILVR